MQLHVLSNLEVTLQRKFRPNLEIHFNSEWNGRLHKLGPLALK